VYLGISRRHDKVTRRGKAGGSSTSGSTSGGPVSVPADPREPSLAAVGGAESSAKEEGGAGGPRGGKSSSKPTGVTEISGGPAPSSIKALIIIKKYIVHAKV